MAGHFDLLAHRLCRYSNQYCGRPCDAEDRVSSLGNSCCWVLCYTHSGRPRKSRSIRNVRVSLKSLSWRPRRFPRMKSSLRSTMVEHGHQMGFLSSSAWSVMSLQCLAVTPRSIWRKRFVMPMSSSLGAW